MAESPNVTCVPHHIAKEMFSVAHFDNYKTLGCRFYHEKMTHGFAGSQGKKFSLHILCANYQVKKTGINFLLVGLIL